MKRLNIAVATAVALSSVVFPATASLVYDPANDFSTVSNPKGVWTYGYTAGGAFTAYPQSGNIDGLDYWSITTAPSLPWIANNPTAATIDWIQIKVNPGELLLHPGQNGDYTVLRFTAPSAGQYDVKGSFFGIDYVSSPTTDVHVLLNGAAIFDGNVTDYRNTIAAFDKLVTLNTGDTVDFAVGWGSNGDYFFDSTGLNAIITAVPEPSTFLTGALILATGAISEFRRRKIAV